MVETNPQQDPQSSTLEESYREILEKAEEQQPGINELLKLYGQFQQGFMQSQEYLQLFHQTFSSSTTDSSITTSC